MKAICRCTGTCKIERFDGKAILRDRIEVAEIVSFQATCHNNVSIADCSVWLYAKNNGYTLLTGDAKLRSSAQKSGVTVCGILRIFDMLVDEFKIIPSNVGAERLELLYKINNRLPSREIENRVRKWSFLQI